MDAHALEHHLFWHILLRVGEAARLPARAVDDDREHLDGGCDALAQLGHAPVRLEDLWREQHDQAARLAHVATQAAQLGEVLAIDEDAVAVGREPVVQPGGQVLRLRPLVREEHVKRLEGGLIICLEPGDVLAALALQTRCDVPVRRGHRC